MGDPITHLNQRGIGVPLGRSLSDTAGAELAVLDALALLALVGRKTGPI
jgi:hypothetical protein